MSVDIECIVIGAGVVGLAAARKLAMAGKEVLLVEAEEAIGMGISSRNSEVIHAGIYYPTNSLKARLCVQGKEMLYRYCEERGIAHQRIGKLLVATSSEQLHQLNKIQAQAKANQVNDLQRLNRQEVLALEPGLHCEAALLSPSTGIIDSHGLMLALQGDLENQGGQCVFHTPLESVIIEDDGTFNCTFGGAEAMSLRCSILVNAAGLHAPRLAHQFKGLNPASIPPEYYCKGNYFTLSGKAPFSHLIYPMPNESGLGVHLTLDLGGQAKFGPDTEWVTEEDYTVNPARAQQFYAAVRSYWPELADGSLEPGYAGIRPKIVSRDEAAADFMISSPAQHGIANLVNLFGIESPGLTSCLALADEVWQALNPTSH